LERLKNIPIEAAWGVLRSKEYQNQFEGEWTILFPEKSMTGRVVTAQYMPLRLDLDEWVKAKGKLEKRSNPPTLSWPIDILTNGDVYVADAYDKVGDGGPIMPQYELAVPPCYREMLFLPRVMVCFSFRHTLLKIWS
jgi:4-hydroxy-4-methyl-2-oxoglutarate aldolase